MAANSTRRRWTPEEDDLLCRVFGMQGWLTLVCRETGRTRAAVVTRASRLGLFGDVDTARRLRQELKDFSGGGPGREEESETAEPDEAEADGLIHRLVRETLAASVGGGRRTVVSPETGINRKAGQALRRLAGCDPVKPAMRLSKHPQQAPQDGRCRWVEGDPRTNRWAYCGHPVEPGTSWCAYHLLRVYVHQGSTGVSGTETEATTEGD